MAEVYSSLFKGLVHITTPYSDKHKAIDLGNYKTKNKIYSPTKFGTGKVTKYTTSYTYNGVLYKNVATIWYTYPNGWVMCLVHGDTADQIVKVGDTVKVGQQIYVTGNKGYSKGDHLHCQLTKNGVYKDPANYVLNDQPAPVVTPPVTPEPVDYKKEAERLQTELDTLRTDYRTLQDQHIKLSDETKLMMEQYNENLAELKELQNKYDGIAIEKNRIENELKEAVSKLNASLSEATTAEIFAELWRRITRSIK